jgi:GntR family transcriptional regulator, rspAB operon transcriptional repressor
MHTVGADITGSATGKRSAAEDAYYEIRKMVVTGVLRPGQIINEQELVQQLGIGRTPTREAIQRLASQQVLEVFPRRGIAVAKMGIDDLQAVFEARETIEAKLAELAAHRRTDEEAQAMERIVEVINSLAKDEVYMEFLDIDQQLHHLIAAAARNRFLAETADHLLMLSDWIWHQYFQLRGSNPAHYFAHELIVDAIVNRDAERAASAMMDHIRESRGVIRSSM